MARPTDLDQTLTADGNTDVVATPGGSVVMVASGTFGSGTLTLQWQSDDGTWFSLSETLTEAGHAAAVVPSGRIRANLAGATSPSVVVRLRSLHDV